MPHITARPFGHRLRLFGIVATFVISPGFSRAEITERPTLHTNESYVEEATRIADFSISDPTAVFAYVINSLPDRVRVYPTENYYYFSFIHNGTPYAGNIQLPPIDRDQGAVHFGFYKDLTEWKNTIEAGAFVTLDASQGVSVERLESLLYRVSYAGKSVVFALNDLSKVKPPPAAISREEKFLGPIFDESGIRFFLIYNIKLKLFHYILDETVTVADEFFASTRTNRIIIGRRTGFAFYRDHRLDRKILIGVFDANSRLNTYFDGPFDQLPDNFIEGDELRDAIIASDPAVAGEINRFGHYLHRRGVRYLIRPFISYRKQSDLYPIHACAAREAARLAGYYRCFISR
jgi:hypothetical protein